MIRRAYTLALCATFAAGFGLTACQDDTDTDSSSSSSASDDDDSSSSNGGAGVGGNGSGATSGTSTSNGGGGAGDPTCGDNAVDATVQQITKGEIGPQIDVKVDGVVAMSQKFLVSKSSSGSCLWGVFISAPGLTTTEAYSGVLALSYGFPAEVPDGGDTAYCPRLGIDPAGDKIPDNVQPGDVLNMIGETDNFLLDNCASETDGSQVPQRQLAKVCAAEKVGTADLPAPAVIASEDYANLASATNTDFHEKWGGVKVRVESVNATPVDGTSGTVVGDYGIINLEGTVELGNKIYYRGYSDDICHGGPQFDATDAAGVSWNQIDAFHYMNYCTWGLQANDKCSDFDPASGDCGTMDTCAPY